MVKLKTIYDDVLATFAGEVRDFDSVTLVNWINESYIAIRDQFISQNRHEQFAIVQHVRDFREDPRIPYLKYGILASPILQHGNVDNLVVYAIGRTHDELKNELQTWQQGDHAWVGTDLFRAVTGIENQNTYALRFKNCEVRNFYPANGLKYKPGDVVKHGEHFYTPVTTAVNTSSTPLQDDNNWQQVFWVYVKSGFIDPEIISFSVVDRKKVTIDTGAAIISFDRNRVYASNQLTSLQLSYIPVHEYKRKNDDEFQIPDIAVTVWRNQVHERMFRNRGMINDEQQ